jgi:DNA repair exonuclease SbcCD ATPase subunit
MANPERRAKEKDLAELSREFQRKQREFREDLNLRQNEENAAIIEKANKAIKQLADKREVRSDRSGCRLGQPETGHHRQGHQGACPIQGREVIDAG